MKSVLINFILILFLIILYALGFFEFFTSETVLWTACGAIIILFIFAIKILGNPWNGK